MLKEAGNGFVLSWCCSLLTHVPSSLCRHYLSLLQPENNPLFRVLVLICSQCAAFLSVIQEDGWLPGMKGGRSAPAVPGALMGPEPAPLPSFLCLFGGGLAFLCSEDPWLTQELFAPSMCSTQKLPLSYCCPTGYLCMGCAQGSVSRDSKAKKSHHRQDRLSMGWHTLAPAKESPAPSMAERRFCQPMSVFKISFIFCHIESEEKKWFLYHLKGPIQFSGLTLFFLPFRQIQTNVCLKKRTGC